MTDAEIAMYAAVRVQTPPEVRLSVQMNRYVALTDNYALAMQFEQQITRQYVANLLSSTQATKGDETP